ncbi:MAG: GspM family type II secretion system protein ExeM [Aeromonas sp.]
MMEKIQTWWHAISPREQRTYGIGAVMLLITLLYAGLWQPLANAVNAREKQVQNQQKTLAWLKEKGQEVMALQRTRGKPLDTSGTLEGVINRTAFSHKIKIARLQPQGDELQVWIDLVAFADLTRWLAALSEQYGIEVQVIELSREAQAPGQVKVRRLQLSRAQ